MVYSFKWPPGSMWRKFCLVVVYVCACVPCFPEGGGDSEDARAKGENIAVWGSSILDIN